MRFAYPLFLMLLVMLAPLSSAAPKVISLGFDGIDPILARQFMAEGELPNLKKLADGGGFCELDTIVPSQSPVCWSSMLNGTNPGKHGVMGFVKRSEGGYTPQLGIIKVEDREILLGSNRHWAAPAAIILLFLVLGMAYASLARRRQMKRTDAEHLPKPKRYYLCLSFLMALPVATLGAWASQQLPASIKQPVNARQGPSYFETLAAKGHKVAALNAPMDWPVAQRDNVLEYAGFNVPDLRGSFGIYSFYTDSYNAGEFVKSEMGADVYRVDLSKGLENTVYQGMRDIMRPEEGYPPIEFKLQLRAKGEGEDQSLQYYLFDQKWTMQHAGTLKVGEWSDWCFLEGHLSHLISVKGKMRFHLEALKPELRLYATPLQFDPSHPAGDNHIANPPHYFPEIEDLVDGMDSLGWPELTHPMYDGNIRDKAFMDHVLMLENKRADVLYDVLKRGEHECVSAWFFGPDRVQHMMYRYIDPENPAYDALQSSPHRTAILDIYKMMDQVVGKVLAEYCDENTLLLVMSDHGFSPFNRAVSLNRWLLDEGYLVLKGKQERRHASDMFTSAREALLTEVDWGKTKAYALGLGKIFLNVQGREPEGIVPADQVDQVSQEIHDKLMLLKDPERGNRDVMNHVYKRSEIAWGDYAGEMADLVVGFKRGYRVSWQTTLGYSDEPVIFANDKTWSGDHCSIDPALIPGSLFANRKLPERAKLWDLAPTILAAFDLPAGEDMDGKAIPLAPLTKKTD